MDALAYHSRGEYILFIRILFSGLCFEFEDFQCNYLNTIRKVMGFRNTNLASFCIHLTASICRIGYDRVTLHHLPHFSFCNNCTYEGTSVTACCNFGSHMNSRARMEVARKPFQIAMAFSCCRKNGALGWAIAIQHSSVTMGEW